MSSPAGRSVVLFVALAFFIYDDLRQRERVASLEEQIAALEFELETSAETPSRSIQRKQSRRRSSERAGRAERSGDLRGGGGEGDLLRVEGAEEEIEARVEAELEARMSARREEFRERFRENMEEAFEDYVAEADLDDATADELRETVEGAFEEISALWQEQGASADRGAMREEMEAIREDLEADVSALLGEEEAEIFLESMRPR